MPVPDTAAWNALYDLADRFFALAPWRWMADTPAFGVHDAESGQTCYCCVLGAGGQIMGLCVFDGAEGWEDYRRMQQGENDPLDANYEQHALTILYGDPGNTRPESMALIRRIGRRYKTKGTLPELTVHRPGWVPRLPDADEAALLLRVGAEALAVCGRVRGEPRLLEGRLLVRQDGRDTRRAEPKVHARLEDLPPLDDITLSRLGRARRLKDAWLGDHFFIPAVITDKERHYFGRQLTWIDATTGLLLDVQMTSPWEPPAAALRARLVELMLDKGVPDAVVVRRGDVARSFAGLGDLLKVVHDPDPHPFLHVQAAFTAYLEEH